MLSKKIVIGTANFVNKYGVFPSKNKISLKEIKKILNYSRLKKINFLDSACSYNNDKILKDVKIENWNIVTKVNFKQAKKNYLLKAKKFLKINEFYGVLVHLKNTREISSQKNYKLFQLLMKLKSKKIIKKIGFSTYSSEDINLLIKKFNFDIIQCPVNILDNRLIDNSLLKKLKKKNIEIHARSVFLQGLLLKNYKNFPKEFKKFKTIFEDYENYVNNLQMSKLDVCLNYIRQIKEIDKIVIGINNKKQLELIINSFNKKKTNLPKLILRKKSNLYKLIDLRRWN